jgi:Domain of unknown function (DUF397)
MTPDTTTRQDWRKSSFSNGSSGCVEIADLPAGGKAVRDSKLGDDGPVLTFTAHEWACFVAGVRAGELS